MSPPPRLLVSVRDPEEAVLACAASADLVDAKDPERGALGALPVPLVRAIVARVGAGVETSAVADGSQDEAELIGNVAAMAATGVGYVKVALGARRDARELSRVAAAAPGRLIAVLFAEDGVPPDIAGPLAQAGFRGAMIDTSGKDGTRLTDHLDGEQLHAFAASCRGHGLLSGLAGSLRVEDIAPLVAHAPGYLGFRGGLCLGGDRTRALDPQRMRAAAEALRASGRRDAA